MRFISYLLPTYKVVKSTISSFKVGLLRQFASTVLYKDNILAQINANIVADLFFKESHNSSSNVPSNPHCLQVNLQGGPIYFGEHFFSFIPQIVLVFLEETMIQ